MLHSMAFKDQDTASKYIRVVNDMVYFYSHISVKFYYLKYIYMGLQPAFFRGSKLKSHSPIRNLHG